MGDFLIGNGLIDGFLDGFLLDIGDCFACPHVTNRRSSGALYGIRLGRDRGACFQAPLLGIFSESDYNNPRSI